jgi:hypothetical protein
VVNSFVDFFDCGFELAAGHVVVLGEAFFKSVHVVFKVGDVDILGFNQSQLGLVFERVECGVAQDGYDWDKELRTDDVGFWVFVRDIDNASVVELAIGLQ